MTKYFTSDTHFFHQNVIKYCNRPWPDIDSMNQGLTDRWNSRINEDDIIYVIGDFHLGQNFKENLPKTVSKLNGYKILILGNHDRIPELYLNAGFAEVHKSLDVEIDIGEHKNMLVRLQHKPMIYQEKIPYNYIFHGHLHGIYKNRGIQIDVGVDARDYYPQTAEELTLNVAPNFGKNSYECLSCNSITDNPLQVCSEVCGTKAFEDEHESRRK